MRIIDVETAWISMLLPVPAGTGCLVCYEKGAKLSDGSKAPARRVCLFADRSTFPVLTKEGRGILERTILWALDRMEQPVNPEEALTATWGSLKVENYER